MIRRGTLSGLALVATLAFALACGGSTPLSASQQDWAGRWVAADGTSLQVFLDGGGSYQGSNTSIDGGSATIGADTLTIGMGPISKDFHIDAAPAENAGAWTMTLDGVVYTKE